MSKILRLFFIILLYFFFANFTNANEIDIISRQEWGANEDYRYIDSDEWKNIFEKNKLDQLYYLSEKEKLDLILEAKKLEIANNFLNSNYSSFFEINEVIKYQNNHKLAWPIAKSSIKNSIIVHHTDTKEDNSYTAINNIYKYHALTKKWGDIGYNFLIGYDGEIFEGRAGGDYVVGAHDKWNNQNSIGIGVIGNYQNKQINEKQLESLEKLIKYLVKKYDMDFTSKVANFKWCINKDYCDEKPIIVSYDYPLIGHRDAGYTSCPGDFLYEQLLDLRKNLITYYKNDKTYLLRQYLKKSNESQLINSLALLEEKIDTISNNEVLSKLNDIKKIILEIEEKKLLAVDSDKDNSFEENNNIRVRLSYPHENNISLKIEGELEAKLYKKNNEYILEFVKSKENKKFLMNFLFIDDKLYLNNREVLNFGEGNYFRVKGYNDNFLTISSWDRKPAWDKNGLFNDNKFRGDIVFYKKNNSLIVVNDVLLNYYLRGLGEVSNSTNYEKIKTIIILARTYAIWYMTKAEKFVGEYYQASDDPNVFQKYTGYGLEQRSPNISKAVKETKDFIVTYKGNLIKPWYFSSSDGYTKSFIDFCIDAKGVIDCSRPSDFPFLIGVKDYGGIGKTRDGHGVGVPGTGIEYFSIRGWTYNLIIKYFLKGVEIKKM